MSDGDGSDAITNLLTIGLLGLAGLYIAAYLGFVPVPKKLARFFPTFCSKSSKAAVCPNDIAGVKKGTCHDMARSMKNAKKSCPDITETLSACPFCAVCDEDFLCQTDDAPPPPYTPPAPSRGDCKCDTYTCTDPNDPNDKGLPCRCHIHYLRKHKNFTCPNAVEQVAKECPACCCSDADCNATDVECPDSAPGPSPDPSPDPECEFDTCDMTVAASCPGSGTCPCHLYWLMNDSDGPKKDMDCAKALKLLQDECPTCCGCTVANGNCDGDERWSREQYEANCPH